MTRDAGLVDRSQRGVVRISGPDRLSWLHSLTTQHLEALPSGTTTRALILSPTGHVQHDLTLTDDGTATWIHVEPGTAAPLVEFLDSMRFMLRVETGDVTGDYAVLTVAGPGSAGADPGPACYGRGGTLPGTNAASSRAPSESRNAAAGAPAGPSSRARATASRAVRAAW